MGENRLVTFNTSKIEPVVLTHNRGSRSFAMNVDSLNEAPYLECISRLKLTKDFDMRDLAKDTRNRVGFPVPLSKVADSSFSILD